MRRCIIDDLNGLCVLAIEMNDLRLDSNYFVTHIQLNLELFVRSDMINLNKGHHLNEFYIAFDLNV